MINRISFSILALILITTLGCKKSKDKPNHPDEDLLIRNYISANHLNVTRDASGIYYEIKNPGEGDEVTMESTVVLNYTGKILNGDQFEEAANTAFKIKNVILAWQIGIAKIRPGGKITLYVPSALAYGKNSPKPGIPSNATLMFDIELIGFLK